MSWQQLSAEFLQISGMLWVGLVLLAAAQVAAEDKVASKACFHHPTDGGSIYDFQELDILERNNISLADYRGKVSKV